jgi:hypothetical protein
MSPCCPAPMSVYSPMSFYSVFLSDWFSVRFCLSMLSLNDPDN